MIIGIYVYLSNYMRNDQKFEWKVKRDGEMLSSLWATTSTAIAGNADARWVWVCRPGSCGSEHASCT